MTLRLLKFADGYTYVKLPATWERGVKKLEKFADIFLGGHLDGKNNGG